MAIVKSAAAYDNPTEMGRAVCRPLASAWVEYSCHLMVKEETKEVLCVACLHTVTLGSCYTH